MKLLLSFRNEVNARAWIMSGGAHGGFLSRKSPNVTQNLTISLIWIITSFGIKRLHHMQWTIVPHSKTQLKTLTSLRTEQLAITSIVSTQASQYGQSKVDAKWQDKKHNFFYIFGQNEKNNGVRLAFVRTKL